MTHQKEETPETDAELFDRWLIEAPTSEFEEFIADAPRLLGTKDLEFLRRCKAQVNARLAAEPNKTVFSLADPHEIRVNCWYQIDERLEAEINFRTGRSNAKVAASQSTRSGDPEVAKRRSIVKGNCTKSAKELCKLFDFQGVPLPSNWEDEFSVKSWKEAYLNKNLTHAIQSLIGRDKADTTKPL